MSVDVDLIRTQNQINWLKQKIYLDSQSEKAKKRIVKRGQVYYCNFGIGIGSEIEKDRPAIIVQDNLPKRCSSNTVVVPITHNQSGLPCMVPLNERLNPTDSSVLLDGQANTSHVVTVCKSRLGDYVCDLSEEEMKRIDKAIANGIDLSHYYLDLKTEYDNLKEKLDDVSLKCEEYKTLLNSILTLFELKDDVDLLSFLAELKKCIDKVD